MRKIAGCALIMLLPVVMSAQTGVGIRLGTDPGITVKHFVRPNGAIEGILHTGYRGVLITGLYEWQKPLGNAAGLSGFLGAGGHIGLFDRWGVYRYNRYGEVVYVYNRPSIGIDGIIGLEYAFQGAPITLGIDLKPTLDFYYGYAYSFIDGALSIRYVF